MTLTRNNFIGIGSSRIVFDNGDGTVSKIPCSHLGVLANEEEYNRARENSDIVARCDSFDGFILVQEKLTDTCAYDYRLTLDGTVLDKLKADYPNEDVQRFVSRLLNSRLTVGRAADGALKQYDYETAKTKLREIAPDYRPIFMRNDEEYIEKFFEYISEVTDMKSTLFEEWLKRS